MSVSKAEKWLTGLLGHEPVVTRVTRRVWKNQPSKPHRDAKAGQGTLPPVTFDIPSLDAPRESIVEGHCILSSYRLPHQSFSEMQPTDLGTLRHSL